MKKLIVAVSMVLIPAIVMAGSITSITFKPYSSATPVSCSVLTGYMDKDGSFMPEPDTTTVLSLGTKAGATWTPSSYDKHIKIVCYPTATGKPNTTVTNTTVFSNFTSFGTTSRYARLATDTVTVTPQVYVKMFFNGSSTIFFPITEQFLKIR